MLGQRIISAVIGIPLFLYSIYLGDVVLLAVVFLLVMTGLFEFRNLIRQSGYQDLAWPFWIGGLIMPLLVQANSESVNATIFIYLLVSCFCFIVYYPRFSPLDFALTLLGIIYVAFGFSHLLMLRKLDYGFQLLVYLFTIIWTTDTGAYLIGINFGKRRLCPEVSPLKSWEGFFGGIMASFVAVSILTLFVPTPYSRHLLLIAPLISAAGQLGDLFESALKRFAQVKDAGRLIPGHGGILDRFDSTLWAAPLTYYLIALTERLF